MAAIYQLAWMCVPLLILAGCGGGGGGGSAPPIAVQNASPGGIWKGNDPISGLSVVGVITETGQLQFIRSDGAMYYGAVSTSGTNVSGNYTGVAPTGFVFSDGSKYGTGSISGTVQARQILSGTLTFTTSAGHQSSGSGTFTFDSLYNSGSSLATIAGNYTDSTDNSVVNVNANGVAFSQSPLTGCVINGQVSIIDASYDAYGISYSFSNCLGSAAFLNGTTARGLGVLDTTTNPPIAIVGVENNAAHYVLVMSLPKQ
jgi:hypothetical protein